MDNQSADENVYEIRCRSTGNFDTVRTKKASEAMSFAHRQAGWSVILVARERLELSHLAALVPKTSVSTNSTTAPYEG